ncbi:thiamine pyrophosphate-binding protein, partial [Candidatus Bathyarchaeota archaeon]|nr:thiamine pyrophosphate-binding protein [Candidatus Bathyarchaeota archaeon]
MNAAKTLLEMFKGYNVEYIFGLPGETTLPLYKEWVSTPEIKHVMMRDERSAAFAADAYSRFAFTPGICESPSVGSTHIIPGIAEAFKAGIPMIALTSDIPLHFEKRNMLTGINQTSLLESITKESITITDAKEIPNIIRRSFRICTTGKPGPVHIRFPSDKQKEEIIDPDLNIQKDFRKYPGHRSVAELTKISEALKILGSAERPVLICGQGVLMSQAWDEVISFAELFGLPVGTTINGKGSFPETHPLSIGVVGARGGTSFSNKLVNEADVLLYIGCSTDSAGTDSWKIPPPDTKARIIHLDISEAEVGNNYQTEVFLIGDAKATLRVIKEVAEKQEKKRRSLTRIKLIQKEATEYYEYVNSFNSSNDLPIHPVKLVNELS